MRRVLVVTLLLALTACSSTPSEDKDAAVSSSSSRTAGCGSSSPADPVDVAGQIGQKGEADFASVFAGARVGDEGVDVYRKPSADTADFDKWVLATFDTACVLLHDAKFSGTDLAKRYQQVNDDNGYWSSQGVTVNSVSSDFVRGVVIVGTEDVGKAGPLFKARYADGVPVEVVKEAPA